MTILNADRSLTANRLSAARHKPSQNFRGHQVLNSSVKIIVLLIALSACQPKKELVVGDSTQQQYESTGWRSDRDYFQESDQNLNDLTQWHYSGKVGITTARLKEQANLVWNYSDQSNTVRLFGPLGVGAIKLEFDQYGVVLSDNKGVLHRGASAQALLTDIVGWPLPIDALSHWLFVLPEPGQPFQYRLNDAGQLASLRQLGWQIEYKDYRQYQQQVLPRKLTAFKQFDTGNQGLVTVKLITKAWH